MSILHKIFPSLCRHEYQVLSAEVELGSLVRGFSIRRLYIEVEAVCNKCQKLKTIKASQGIPPYKYWEEQDIPQEYFYALYKKASNKLGLAKGLGEQDLKKTLDK